MVIEEDQSDREGIIYLERIWTRYKGCAGGAIPWKHYSDFKIDSLANREPAQAGQNWRECDVAVSLDQRFFISLFSIFALDSVGSLQSMDHKCTPGVDANCFAKVTCLTPSIASFTGSTSRSGFVSSCAFSRVVPSMDRLLPAYRGTVFRSARSPADHTSVLPHLEICSFQRRTL